MIDCIIIGAGPCGIVATKELLEQNIKNVLCLEQSQTLGGTFASTYDNLKLTSSATFSMFSDYWVGPNQEHTFWTKDEAIDYWTRYAEHFNVLERIHFGNKVVEISTELTNSGYGEIWNVITASGIERQCKRIVLAIGNNRIPKYPEWKKKLTRVAVMHSKNYKNNEQFKGKKVLIVGGGESGSDVANEVSSVAEKCMVSLRNSTGWVVPRKRNGHAADISTHRGIWTLPVVYGKELGERIIKKERSRKDPVFDAVAELNASVDSKYGIRGIFGTKTLALPHAMVHNGCTIVSEIISVEDGGRKLKTRKGVLLEDIDIVIFCTGYRNNIPFLPKELQHCDPRSMYKHMIHLVTRDRIAWLGWARPGFGSQFPIMEMQARFFALLVAGKHQLPSASELERVTALDKAHYLEIFQDNAYRTRSLVDYHTYMDDISSLIGCNPPLTKYFFIYPKLWLKMVYGPTQGTQFRLKGPGKKLRMAHEILKKVPLSSFNFIIKQGIRGRLKYFFLK